MSIKLTLQNSHYTALYKKEIFYISVYPYDVGYSVSIVSKDTGQGYEFFYNSSTPPTKSDLKYYITKTI